MPINEDGIIVGPRKSDTQNIIQGRDGMEWVRKMFGLDVWSDLYQAKNFFVGTYPFPGTSQYNDDNMSAEVINTPGTGAAMILLLTAPPRGTLRVWILVSFETDDATARDYKYGVQRAGVNFFIGGNSANDDDPFSMAGLYCHSGMRPVLSISASNIAASYTIKGLFLDVPEGEVPSIGTIFAMNP